MEGKRTKFTVRKNSQQDHFFLKEKKKSLISQNRLCTKPGWIAITWVSELEDDSSSLSQHLRRIVGEQAELNQVLLGLAEWGERI